MVIQMTQSEIALFLRKQRKERDATMRQIGAEAGISAAQVSNAENPNDASRISTREILLRHYGYKMEAVYNVSPLSASSN